MDLRLWRSSFLLQLLRKVCVFSIKLSSVSNRRRRTLSHFQATRRELKIRRAEEYFWGSSRCLEIWSNTVSNVWYIFSIKTTLRRKQRNKIVKIYADYDQISKHGHGHGYKLDELLMNLRIQHLSLLQWSLALHRLDYTVLKNLFWKMLKPSLTFFKTVKRELGPKFTEFQVVCNALGDLSNCMWSHQTEKYHCG